MIDRADPRENTNSLSYSSNCSYVNLLELSMFRLHNANNIQFRNTSEVNIHRGLKEAFLFFISLIVPNGVFNKAFFFLNAIL